MPDFKSVFRKKKFLGQHFLKNKKILEEMARAAELTKRDVVLEVGPGLGHLTEILASRAKIVIAVEKDRDLIPVLCEKFGKYRNVEIIQGDILKFRISRPHKVVANLPYYITSRFLRLFLTQTKFRPMPKLMVLMVQHEVAKRICAKPPHMNLLALSVQLYAEPEIIRKVSRGQFSPPPKVDSAIIRITPYPPTPFPLRPPAGRAGKGKGGAKNESLPPYEGGRAGLGVEKILSVARLAFQQKRKMLRKSLKHAAWNLKHDSSFMLKDSRFNKRPEELSLEDWADIVVK